MEKPIRGKCGVSRSNCPQIQQHFSCPLFRSEIGDMLSNWLKINECPGTKKPKSEPSKFSEFDERIKDVLAVVNTMQKDLIDFKNKTEKDFADFKAKTEKDIADLKKAIDKKKDD